MGQAELTETTACGHQIVPERGRRGVWDTMDPESLTLTLLWLPNVLPTESTREQLRKIRPATQLYNWSLSEWVLLIKFSYKWCLGRESGKQGWGGWQRPIKGFSLHNNHALTPLSLPQLRARVSESPGHRLTLRVALNLVWWQIDCVSKVSADLALPCACKGSPYGRKWSASATGRDWV